MLQTVVERIQAHIAGYLNENHAVYEIMWNIMLQPDNPQMTKYSGACAFYDR
jgi:hypothetical protein